MTLFKPKLFYKLPEVKPEIFYKLLKASSSRQAEERSDEHTKGM
jgi:hypothetical protein